MMVVTSLYLVCLDPKESRGIIMFSRQDLQCARPAFNLKGDVYYVPSAP